jgi:class 3 adenylate cyclase
MAQVAAKTARRTAAILDAHAVDRSRLTDRHEGSRSARLAQHRVERFAPAVARHGGRLVKLTGESARAEFPTAVKALGAAIEFQQAVAAANRGQSEDTAVVFRLGLHFGDASEDGDTVAVRQPEEWRVRGGGIVVSAQLRDAVARRVKASFAELGNAGLGTVERPVHVYEVGWDPADWPAASAATATAITARGDERRLGRWASAIGWAALVIGILYLALVPRPQPASAGWRVTDAESFDRAQLERRAEAALARWQQEQNGDEQDDPENAQPADAYDGVYTGTATARADGRVVTYNVKVTNGVGSGTQSRLDCGTAPLSLRISPSGDVGGMVLMFGSTCLKTELAIRGRAVGTMLQLRLGSQYVELSKPDH